MVRVKRLLLLSVNLIIAASVDCSARVDLSA